MTQCAGNFEHNTATVVEGRGEDAEMAKRFPTSAPEINQVGNPSKRLLCVMDSVKWVSVIVNEYRF